MFSTAFLSALCILCGSVSSLSAEPPIVGRPVDFFGAIGGPFVVTMDIDRQTIAVEEPFTLTLRIVGPGNLKDIPRPALAKLGAFKDFAVDDLDDSFVEGSPPSRTFRYRLRARTADANRIPPFKFVYFNPAIVPPSRGYQTTYAEAAPIQVTAAPTTAATPSDLPQRIFELRRRIATNPDDNEAWEALSELRSEVRYPSEDMRPKVWVWPMPYLSSFAIIFAAIAIVAFINWRRRRAGSHLMGLVCSVIMGTLCTIGAVVERRYRARNEETPVVVKHDTPLRGGNGDEYPNRIDALLPAGAEVRRLYERQGWLQVELPNGVVGWVTSDAIIQ